MLSSSLRALSNEGGVAVAESDLGAAFGVVAMSEVLAESGDRRQGKTVKIA
jgi:hypothetical protein